MRLWEEIKTARAGETYLFSTGQAGFILKNAAGETLGIDLYLSDSTERGEGSAGFKRLLPRLIEPAEASLDVLICTHPHLDHFDVDAVPAMLANGARLFCSVDCEAIVRRLGLDYNAERITYVRPGDVFTAGGFGIRFVSCDHGKSAPDAVGVVVTADGKTVYEAGDTCLRLDRAAELPEHIDVMIAPINGMFGNMNEAECAAYAEAVRPGVTVPCHYGMFAAHRGDVGAFYARMTEKGLPLLLMRQGEGIRL